jgi:hypothetical protein
LAGDEAFSFVLYQLERGIQIESLVSGIVMLTHLVIGLDVVTEWAHSTWQISSPLAPALAGLLPFLGIGLLAVIGFAAFRHFRAEVQSHQASSPGDLLVAYLLASLLVVMLTNKVLSPQYLVWLLPLIALRPMREVFVLALAGVLSILVFPLNWQALINLDPGMILIVNLRNLLLLALLVLLAWQHLPGTLRRAPPSTVAS